MSEIHIDTARAIALHGQLAGAGIALVVLHYEGSGDSGNECHVSLWRKPEAEEKGMYPFMYSSPAGFDYITSRFMPVATTKEEYNKSLERYTVRLDWNGEGESERARLNDLQVSALEGLAHELFNGVWNAIMSSHDPDFNNEGCYGEFIWDLSNPASAMIEHNVRIESTDQFNTENVFGIPEGGPADEAPPAALSGGEKEVAA